MKIRAFLLPGILAGVVIGGLLLYGNVGSTAQAVAGFPGSALTIALALALVSFLLRLLRWLLFSRTLRLGVPLRENGLIFLSGLPMAVTPGGIGQLIKPYLLQQKFRVPLAQSIPMVLLERVVDVVAVGLLALVGLTAFLPVYWVGIVGFLVCGFLVAVTLSPRAGVRLTRMPGLRRWGEHLTTSNEALRALVSPRTLAMALAITLPAWLSESTAFWLILRELGAGSPIAQAISIYSLATLGGAAMLLPGGLGATEGGMVGLLKVASVGSAVAAAATLLIRLCTLWFGVAVGLVPLLAMLRPSQVTVSRQQR